MVSSSGNKVIFYPHPIYHLSSRHLEYLGSLGSSFGRSSTRFSSFSSASNADILISGKKLIFRMNGGLTISIHLGRVGLFSKCAAYCGVYGVCVCVCGRVRVGEGVEMFQMMKSNKFNINFPPHYEKKATTLLTTTTTVKTILFALQTTIKHKK